MENLIGVLGIVIIFGTIIAVHEFGHFIVAKLSRMGVHEFSIGFGRALFSKRHRGTLYAVRIVPLGGYVRIAGMELEDTDEQREAPDSFNNKPFVAKFATILAGGVMNFMLALLVIIVIGLAIGYPNPQGPAIVNELANPSPAYTAGVLPGDIITGINDHHDVNLGNAATYIRGSEGDLRLTVLRDGEEQQFVVVPEVLTSMTVDGFHIREVQYRGIGVEMTSTYATVSMKEAVVEGAYGLSKRLQFAVANITYMASGKAKLTDVGGPVMIMRLSYDVSKDAFQSAERTARFFSTLALFSVLIGFFNLLPIPALDGGRLLSLSAEHVYKRITGRSFDRKKEAMVHVVGMILLLAFILVITIKDIGQWIGIIGR